VGIQCVRRAGHLLESELKLAKFQGAFDWHHHDNEDSAIDQEQ